MHIIIKKNYVKNIVLRKLRSRKLWQGKALLSIDNSKNKILQSRNSVSYMLLASTYLHG